MLTKISKTAKHLLNEHKIFLAILVLGMFLRMHNPLELFYYGHDQDLAGWFVRDVVENKHLRLIGQETSTQGIFIGPLYYYMLIPFYLMFGMDPAGGLILIYLLGAFSIVSVYYVFLRIFGKREALIATFIYAVSFYTVFDDREVVPTMPVITWSVWYLYSVHLLLKARFKDGLLLSGILLGLIWHLNVALVLLTPLIPISIFISGRKVKLSEIKKGTIGFGVLVLPLILFEVRHGFLQLRGFVVSMTTDQHAPVEGFERFARAVHLMSKNFNNLIWGSYVNVEYEMVLFALLIVFVALVYKKLISRKLAIVMSLWILFYISFFSLYSKNLSEYYLNGTIIVAIVILTIGIESLLRKRTLRNIGIALIAVFGIVNIHRTLYVEVNKSGYLYRKAVVSEIKHDAQNKDYPCLSISYITKPGYDFGYRYLYYYYDMHVNLPPSGSPVYTIVYPLREDIAVDRTFGALGLIYPDYSKYNTAGVMESCSGENHNLTEPMWGMPI